VNLLDKPFKINRARNEDGYEQDGRGDPNEGATAESGVTSELTPTPSEWGLSERVLKRE
jgi:hypothetical protein